MINAGCKIQGYGKRQHIQDLFIKAAEANIYTVNSDELRGVGYAYEDDCIAIVTTEGWMKMPMHTAKIIAEEIQGIIEDIEDLRRMKVQV